jgi:regulator of protease activity HflC (stomatin/prohibitin superfamily)
VSFIAAVVLAIAFIVVPFSFHTVQTGQVAVVKHLGKATHKRQAGTYYDFWLTNKYQKYDAKVQNTPIETAAYSSDAQTMNVQMNIQYQIHVDKVMDIANRYGKLEALDNRLVAVVMEKTKSVLSAHKAMDIIANRSAMSPAVEEAVMKAVGEEYCIDIVSVVLTNIDFSDAFETAVEEKMIAEQKQLKASYENETKIAKAEADAKAKIIAAEADKKANDLLVVSLNDKILRKLWIEKWNGKMPTYYGGNADLMFNMGQ